MLADKIPLSVESTHCDSTCLAGNTCRKVSGVLFRHKRSVIVLMLMNPGCSLFLGRSVCDFVSSRGAGSV